MLKQTRVLLVLVLALLLCVAGVSSALATGFDPETGAVTGDEANPVQAAISKVLRLPVETDVPTAIFNFIATPVSVDGDTNRAGPALNNLSVSYPDADAIVEGPEGNVLSLVVETGNIFQGVDFPHAGIYVYTVTEAPGPNTAIDADPNQQLTYSDAAYELTVFVKDRADGSGRFVYALGARITVAGEGQNAGDKVDPTPGGDQAYYFFSQMTFVNDYVKTNPTDPEAGASTLFVSKVVTGDFASREQMFDFSMTLTVPFILENPPAHYRAYLVDADGSVSDTYIQVSTTVPTTFSLKHGQRLLFFDTPVGTAYTVTETGTPNYFPSAVITTNGAAVGIPEDAMGAPLATGERFVGEADNSAAFRNRRNSAPITGLDLNDLPFIVLIALGLGALVTFIVVKARKRARYS